MCVEEDLEYYRNILNYMGANVPIQVLCLPKDVENILLKKDLLRVYDLFGHPLEEIKGIGTERANFIRERMSDFTSFPI